MCVTKEEERYKQDTAEENMQKRVSSSRNH